MTYVPRFRLPVVPWFKAMVMVLSIVVMVCNGLGAGKPGDAHRPATRSVQDLTWEQTGGPRGFQANLIAASSPTNVYAGTTDGVFYHFDGSSWTDISPVSTNTYVNQIVLAPNGDLYVAGDNHPWWSTIGILKYSGGVWTDLSAGLPTPADWYPYIAIDPTDGSLYLCVIVGIFRYNGAGWDLIPDTYLKYHGPILFHPSNHHLFICNGGGVEYDQSNFTSLSACPESPYMMAMAPSGTLYAASAYHVFSYNTVSQAWEQVGALNTGNNQIQNISITQNTEEVFVSTDNAIYRYTQSGGWQQVSGEGTENIVCNGYPGLVSIGAHGVIAGLRSEEIVASADDGDSWTTLSTGFIATTQEALACDPDGVHLVAGGRGIYLSADDGAHWQRSGSTVLSSGSSVTVLTYMKKNTVGYYFAGTPNGIYRSSNLGVDWEDVNTTVTRRAIHGFCVPKTGYYAGKVLAATDAGLFVADPDAGNWTQLSNFGTVHGITVSVTGDSLFAVSDNTLEMAVAPGTSWDILSWLPDYYNRQEGNPITFTQAGNLLLGTKSGIYRSSDNGLTWNIVSAAGAKRTSGRAPDGSAIPAADTIFIVDNVYAFVQAPDGNVFAATDLGVYESDADGLSWTAQNTGFPSANPQTLALAMNKNYYLYSGLLQHGVWKTAAPVYSTTLVSGKIFLDAASDCDAGQQGMYHWKVKLVETHHVAFSDENGLYSFSNTTLIPGTYHFMLYVAPTYPNYVATCPSPSTSDLTVAVSYDGIHPLQEPNFGVQHIPGKKDLKIDLAGGVARPGRKKAYSIHYQNVGSDAIDNAVVTFTPPNHTTYEDAFSSPADNGHTSDPFWNLGTLNPGAEGYIFLRVLIAPPPAVTLGDLLHSKATIEPIIGDAHKPDNTALETEKVRLSMDPNEKSVLPVGIGEQHLILVHDTLRYHIDFQNVGTDTAFDVVVKDTLDPNLDLGTFDVGAASHPFTYTINGDGELNFIFSGIDLPDSTTDEFGSHGFVEFTIQPLPDAAVGTDIFNRAGIYFDFNLPVLTNTVFNRIGVPDTLRLNPRWNLVSKPFCDIGDSVHLIYPLYTPPAFGYSPTGGYTAAECMADGKGYWLKSDSIRNFLFMAAGFDSLTVPVDSGWNIIGSIGGAIPASAIQSVPDGIIVSSIYGYNSGYVPTDVIAPGKGYWVKAAHPGSLILKR